MDSQLQEVACVDNDDSAISALRMEPRIFKLPTILLISSCSIKLASYFLDSKMSYKRQKLLHPVTFSASSSIKLALEHCPITLNFDWGTPCGRAELLSYFPPALPRRALQYLRKCQLVLAQPVFTPDTIGNAI